MITDAATDGRPKGSRPEYPLHERIVLLPADRPGARLAVLGGKVFVGEGGEEPAVTAFDARTRE